MKQEKFILNSALIRANACAAINAAEDGRIVTIADINRSKEQNALLHMWFGEIARQRDGMTLLDVKGECHHKYGLVIRMSDPVFNWVWGKTGANLTYEKQCKYLASETIAVSSAMTVPELRGYMNDMSRDYRAEGFHLTDPELLKYEGMQE